MSRYPLFDRSALSIPPLAAREHDLHISIIADPTPAAIVPEAFLQIGRALHLAKKQKAARVLMMGAHVLRRGCQRYLADLMEQGLISCIAVNGACVIHDYEFALIGATTESVARYIKKGMFGLWKETGHINDIVKKGAKENIGIGEAIGKFIFESDYKYKKDSFFATAYKLNIPVTVHVGIGYDIVAEHPNFDGAAWGSSSYTDFLIFAHELTKLKNGVVMNFGSAVMAPEIYLKALSMARNILAPQEELPISQLTTLVCDLHDLPNNVMKEAPRGTSAYYYRPWKTMLARTVADGGMAYYVKGDHAETIQALWTASLN